MAAVLLTVPHLASHLSICHEIQECLDMRPARDTLITHHITVGTSQRELQIRAIQQIDRISIMQTKSPRRLHRTPTAKLGGCCNREYRSSRPRRELPAFAEAERQVGSQPR